MKIKYLLYFLRVNAVGPSSIESILCEAIKLEFEAFSSIAQYNSNSRELNDAERAKLNELIVANKALLVPLDDDINNLIGEDYKFKVRHSRLTEMFELICIFSSFYRAIRRRCWRRIPPWWT